MCGEVDVNTRCGDVIAGRNALFVATLTGETWLRCLLRHSKRHDVGSFVSWQVYFHCNDCSRCHRTVAALAEAPLHPSVWEFSIIYCKRYICHGFWKPLSLISLMLLKKYLSRLLHPLLPQPCHVTLCCTSRDLEMGGGVIAFWRDMPCSNCPKYHLMEA